MINEIFGLSIPVNLILVDCFVILKILFLPDHLVIVLLGLSFPGPDVSQTPLVVTPARQVTLQHTRYNTYLFCSRCHSSVVREDL